MALKFLHPKGKDDGLEDEIKSMVEEGKGSGSIEEAEARMIRNIFELDDKEVKDIMTHREHIAGFEAECILNEVITEMLDGNNSRYPVYEENVDSIVGILHFKDAVKAQAMDGAGEKSLGEIEGLLKDAIFIPETKKIDSLFRTMQMRKMHMAIVIDEYGQTSGLVTMEDILEEIVGNILDEHDEDEINIRRVSPDTFIMNGLTPLSEAEEKLGIEFPDEGVQTLNGFLTAILGHVPKSGEIFETEYGGYRFHVVSIRNHVIQKVRVRKESPETAGDG
ncbi:MAG: hemolysin family protein [Lachnospiraceae bacterium]|nr:hemolysin family protein [Lachnospiraceae bacterium]